VDQKEVQNAVQLTVNGMHESKAGIEKGLKDVTPKEFEIVTVN
jgi:hypothetical protein